MKIQFLKNIISNKLRPGRLSFMKSRTKGLQSLTSNKIPPGISHIINLFDKYKQSSPFIISGVILFVSIVIWFVLAIPFRSKNEQLRDELANKVSEFERYTGMRKDIYNTRWIEAKDREIDLVEKELQACREFLAKRDAPIEKVFTDIAGERIKDEALWKDVYIRKTDALLRLLRQNRFEIDKDDLSFKSWGNKLPLLDEISIEQKRFWIQDEIINIIIKNRALIRGFGGLRFRETPQTANLLPQALITTIPFTLESELEPEKIFYLINDILNSGLNFYIETINIESTGRMGDVSNNTLHILDKVTIDAYALDYKNEM